MVFYRLAFLWAVNGDGRPSWRSIVGATPLTITSAKREKNEQVCWKEKGGTYVGKKQVKRGLPGDRECIEPAVGIRRSVHGRRGIAGVGAVRAEADRIGCDRE